MSADEERARVVPVIAAVRAALGARFPISVDTFYAAVARDAVGAGATMVNDVSGGEADAGMRAAVAELGVPFVVMHTRGDAAGMAARAVYAPAGADGRAAPAAAEAAAVADAVPRALLAAAAAAVAAGVPRWDVVLDPGLGFAKAPVHSFALLRRNAALADSGFPLLFGPSRKGFLGAATGRDDPRARGPATAAAVAVAVAAGADFVRVHDVADMRDAARVADAVFRAPP